MGWRAPRFQICQSLKGKVDALASYAAILKSIIHRDQQLSYQSGTLYSGGKCSGATVPNGLVVAL